MIAWGTVQVALQNWVELATGLADTHVTWVQGGAPRPSGPYVSMRVLSIRSVGHDWMQVADAPLVLADDAVESVDASANTLTLTAHAYATGDGPVRFATTGGLPGGLAVLTDYWLIKASANTVKVASSRTLAIALTAIDLTDVGSGVHTISDTASTERVGEEIQHTVRGVRDCILTIQYFGTSAIGDAAPAAKLSRLAAYAKLPSVAPALRAAGIGLSTIGAAQSIDGLVGVSTFEPRALLDVRFFLAEEVTELSTYVESVELQNLTTGGPEFVVPAP